jgi:glyoxylase-like metal-dependent hydrolase (beta-lactamase superfamily II)
MRRPSLMVTEVAAGVHVLGSLRFNWYVVEQGGRFTVVDAGLPAHWAQLGALLEWFGEDLSSVEAVLLTHGHADHAGNAERIRDGCGASVYAHPADWPDVRSGRLPRPTAAQVLRLVRPSWLTFTVEMARGGAMRFPPVQELSELEDGAALDVPGRPRVVAVPGHTAGSCALHLPAGGVVFTGDALVTLNPAARAPVRRGPQLACDAFQEDAAQALASLARLEALDAHTVLPGHGEPWTGGVGEAVQRARTLGRLP